MASAFLLGPALCQAGALDGESAGQPFVYNASENFTTDDAPPNDSIRAVRVFGDKVWVGTDAGLAVLDGAVWRTWTHLDPHRHQPLGRIQAIDVDARTEDVWLGTFGGGIVRFSGGRFERFDQMNSGLAGNLVFDLLIAGGRVWAATNGGVSAFDPVRGVWGLYLERRADAPEQVVTSLALDESGTILCAADWRLPRWRIDPERETVSSVADDAFSPPSGEISGASAESAVRAFQLATRHSELATPGQATPRPPAAAGATGSLQAVAIGVLVPAGKTIALPGQARQSPDGSGQLDLPAVQLAIAHANIRGGYRGSMPFTVAADDSGYARYGWTLPEDYLVTLAGRADVCGIVGWLGPHAYYAAAAAQRVKMPILDAAPAEVDTDKPAHPWMFDCPGDDPQRALNLVDHIIDRLGYTRLAVVRTPTPAGQALLDVVADHLRGRGHPPAMDSPYDPQSADPSQVLDAIRRSGAQVVLTCSDAEVAAALLRNMRTSGMTQLFVGSEHIVTAEFSELVGLDPGPVVALWTCSTIGDNQARTRFAESYRAKFRRPPRRGSFRSYDATTYLLRAINLAGPDREAVRQTLWDMRGAFMARLEDGHWAFGGAKRTGRPAPCGGQIDEP